MTPDQDLVNPRFAARAAAEEARGTDITHLTSPRSAPLLGEYRFNLDRAVLRVLNNSKGRVANEAALVERVYRDATADEASGEVGVEGVRRSVLNLRFLGLLSPESFELTEDGETAAGLPFKPRVSSFLFEASRQGVLADAQLPAAILEAGSGGFKASVPTWRSALSDDAYSDLLGYAHVLRGLPGSVPPRGFGVEPSAMRRIQDIQRDVCRLVHPIEAAVRGSLDAVLVRTFSDTLFARDRAEITGGGNVRYRYRSLREPSEAVFVLAPNSVLVGREPEFLMGRPRPMKSPPPGAEYFELHFCTSVCEEGYQVSRPLPPRERLKGLSALEALRGKLPE